MGLGPTLMFMGKRYSIIASLTTSPIIALVLTTCIGSYLVLLNYPIYLWAISYLKLSIFCSIILSFIAGLLYRQHYQFDWRLMIYISLGLLLTYCIVELPLIAGGLDFAALRGNSIDDFNYIPITLQDANTGECKI
jgi:hypothetical protein